jgi:hypothetical protein
MAVRFFKNGVISEPELELRLWNLGYDALSITRIVGNALREIAVAKQKADLKAAIEAAKKAAALEKEKLRLVKEQLKALEVAKKKALAEYKAKLHGLIINSTDKNVVDWFNNGDVELWDVYYRLYHRDFRIGDAERWVKDRLPKTTKEERNAASKKAQTLYNSEPNPPLIP